MRRAPVPDNPGRHGGQGLASEAPPAPPSPPLSPQHPGVSMFFCDGLGDRKRTPCLDPSPTPGTGARAAQRNSHPTYVRFRVWKILEICSMTGPVSGSFIHWVLFRGFSSMSSNAVRKTEQGRLTAPHTQEAGSDGSFLRGRASRHQGPRRNPSTSPQQALICWHSSAPAVRRPCPPP